MVAASFITTLLLSLAISIAAKPVFERKLPIKLPLTKRLSFASYNVVERDRRRVNSLGRRTGNQDNSGSNPISTAAFFHGSFYALSVVVGNQTCKWLQHLVVDVEILIGSFFTVQLELDSGRWAGNVQLLHARLKWFFTARTHGLDLKKPTCRQIQASRQKTRW